MLPTSFSFANSLSRGIWSGRPKRQPKSWIKQSDYDIWWTVVDRIDMCVCTLVSAFVNAYVAVVVAGLVVGAYIAT